jgi:hypothetical protein
MKIQLTKPQRDHLMRPVVGVGGWQSLIRKLQAQTRGNVLTLTLHDGHKLLRYTLTYGRGGWQAQLAESFKRGQSKSVICPDCFVDTSVRPHRDGCVHEPVQQQA